MLHALLESSNDLGSRLLEKLGANLPKLKDECIKEIDRLPKVIGAADQMYLSRELAQVLETANSNAKKIQDKFTGVDMVMLALSVTTPTKEFLKNIIFHHQNLIRQLMICERGKVWIVKQLMRI